MKILKLLLICALMISPAIAAELEVEAEESLEWHRDQKMYLAKGNAKAIRDGKSIVADTLYAHYEETEGKEIEIVRIEAIEDVLIESGETKIVGDKGVYDVKNKVFTITGDGLDVLSPGYQIKAEESIVYNELDNNVVANGDVIVYQADNEMRSDKLTAFLDDNAEGNQEVSEIFVSGNVEIITSTDKITGAEGYYNIADETAEVEGSVVIARENSVITGDKATVNMKTGVAKMASKSKKDKVRAIFVSE